MIEEVGLELVSCHFPANAKRTLEQDVNVWISNAYPTVSFIQGVP